MCGHVVEAFHSVIVVWLVFGDDVVEDLIEIVANVGVGVFVDCQATRGVLYEYVEKADLREGSGEMAKDLAGYQMAASTEWLKAEFGLGSHLMMNYQ